MGSFSQLRTILSDVYFVYTPKSRTICAEMVRQCYLHQALLLQDRTQFN